MKEIQKKYNIILSYEDSFARRIATGVIVRRPVSVWQILIPFMFIIRFLAMKRETETFVRNFLFTRKPALDAASAIIKGGDRQTLIARIEKETRDRLQSLKLYSPRVHRGQLALIDLLIDHYCRLLNAEGNSYHSLVKNSYQTQSNYETFLGQLTLAEKELDNAVFAALGQEHRLQEEISTKQQIIDQLREKEIDDIF